MKLSAVYGLEVKENTQFGRGMVSVKQTNLKPYTKRGSLRPTENMSMMDTTEILQANKQEKEIRLSNDFLTETDQKEGKIIKC